MAAYWFASEAGPVGLPAERMLLTLSVSTMPGTASRGGAIGSSQYTTSASRLLRTRTLRSATYDQDLRNRIHTRTTGVTTKCAMP
jgi:hypothetical protein